MARQIQRYTPDFDNMDGAYLTPASDGTCVLWNDVAPILAESRKTVRSAVQHVKPKMPSYKAFDEYCHSINIDGVQSAHLFRYFARHFGR